MKYNLKNDIEIQNFKEYSKRLIDSGQFVELKKVAVKRSNQQNRYLHLLLAMFAMEYGETAEYTKQVIFKKLVNSEIFKTEYSNRQTGEIREDYRSTIDLSSAELTTAIERFRNYSVKTIGLYLPEPHEEERLKWIECEMERYREYL